MQKNLSVCLSHPIRIQLVINLGNFFNFSDKRLDQRFSGSRTLILKLVLLAKD